MAIRQNVGIGGLYPTGRAPLAVDLTDPSRAITERMIKREQSRIEEEKTEIKENQKKILDAFSYEAVLGASEKMQMQHLHNLNNFIDEWSDKLAAKGGKLSQTEQFELLKAKHKVNSERVNMQTNIKEMETVQGLLLKDPNAKIYSKESHQRFADAVSSGKAGDLNFDWLSVLEPRKEDMFTVMADKEMQNFVDTMTENVDMGQITLNEDGTYSWGESNERILKQNFDKFFRSWRGQDIFRNYGGDTNAYQQMKGEFESILTRNIQKSKLDTGVYRQQMKGDEVSREQAENLAFFNDIAEGILRADKSTLDSLSGAIDKELGAIEFVTYKKIGDEEYINISPFDKKKEAQLIPLPPVDADETRKQAFKKLILDRFSFIGGKQLDKNIMKHIPSYYAKFQGTEPSMPESLKTVTLALSNLPKVAKEDKYADYIMQLTKDALPDVVIEKPRNKIGFRIDYKVKITDPSAEGENKIKEYDLRNATDRQELSDWLIEKSNYKEAMQDRWNPNAGEEQREENGEERLRLSASEILKREEIIDQFMKDNKDNPNLNRDIAIRILIDNGKISE